MAADITNDTVVNSIVSAQSTIGGRSVKPENLHFTLCFLGEVDSTRIPDITATLNAIKFDAFDVILYDIGTFGRPARLIWVGVTEDTHIQRLSNDINRALKQKSGKKFTPHITISRLKRNDTIDIAKYKKYTWGVQRIDRFKIKKSELKPTGPIYTDIAEVACKQ